MSYSLELREKRAKLAVESKSILDKAAAEKRGMNAQENEQWDKLSAEIDSLRNTIDKLEQQEVLDKELDKAIESRKVVVTDRKPGNKEEAQIDLIKEGVRHYIQNGKAGMPSDCYAALMRHTEKRSAGESGISGFAVDDGFALNISRVLKSFVGVRSAPVTYVETDSGLDYPWLVSDDTSNTGELLAENSQTASNADASYSQVTLKSYMFSSKLMPMSRQMLQDIARAESDITKNAGDRIGRIQNTYFTTGTGTSQPQGIVTGAGTAGPTTTTGQTTTLISDNLYDVIEAVDPAYRAEFGSDGKPLSGFMMSSATKTSIRKLKDTLGRPLWQPGLAFGAPDTIDVFPVYINQAMATLAASHKAVLFGNFSRYVIRDVKGASLLRLEERLADFFQVGFLGFLRSDGRVLDANAFAYITQAAS